MDMNCRPIFIGGLGRSGTTILQRILGRHSHICSVGETKFIIEPDGLITLVDALSTKWSGWMSDKALRRFEELMWSLNQTSHTDRLLGAVSKKLRANLYSLYAPHEYARENLGRTLNAAHFDSTVKEFLQELEDFRYSGRWAGTKAFQFRPYVRHGKRFSREEVVSLCSDFVNQLFSHAVQNAGTTRWCEKKTENLVLSDFLLELFPNLQLLHIYRDPRDVVSSSTQKRHLWAPANVELGVRRMKNVLDRWTEKREHLPLKTYMEICFEDLVRNQEETLTKVCDFLDLEFDPAMLDIKLENHHIGRYKDDLSSSQIKMVESLLGNWMSTNGNYMQSNGSSA